ncbi:hypothetical protein K8I31_04280, partial [bacterium]|nr:hypothetical protein [bacterium]
TLGYRVMDTLNLELRLLEAEYELYELGKFRELLESKIEEEIKKKQDKFNLVKRESQDDPEWLAAQDIYEWNVNCRIPWLLRSPFIIMLHSTFENTVTEIAKELRKKQGISIELNDLKGNWSARSKKYFQKVLKFPLPTDHKYWSQICNLSQLRNIFAHSNGRLDLINENTKKWLKDQEKNLNIKLDYEYVVLPRDLLTELFEATKSVLKDLMDRYKAFDDLHKKKNEKGAKGKASRSDDSP